MPEQKRVAAYFNDANAAHRAFDELLAAGFSSPQIGCLYSERSEHGESFWERVKHMFSADVSDDPDHYPNSDAQRAALTGSDSINAVYDFDEERYEAASEGVDDSAFDPDSAQYFRDRVNCGGILISVFDPDGGRRDIGREILKRNGGDLGTKREQQEWEGRALSESEQAEVNGREMRLRGEIARMYDKRKAEGIIGPRSRKSA